MRAWIVASISLCFGMGVFAAAASAEDSVITLASSGSTSYVIVTSPSPSLEETTAATWLSETLEQVTGAVFPVQRENTESLPPTVIRVAADSSMKSEEWRIRTVDGALLLTGGVPRGTMYSVCEFLETHVGVQRFDVFTEWVPRTPELTLPQLDRTGRPAFRHRYIFTGFPYAHSAPTGINAQRWRVWNKELSYVGPATGDYPRIVPEGVHTFGHFMSAKEFAAAHPEYFSMDAEGRRMVDDQGQRGAWIQLCVTNSEVREITLERARQMLKEDRLDAERSGRTPAQLLVLSQNDNTANLCLCPNCRAVSDREGSESGPLIEYVNFVAAGIRDDFPDVTVQTEAYNFTLKPPKSIGPLPNVMVRYCDNYGLSDMTRPLRDPRNAERLALLDGWAKVSSQLAIWDYWRTIEDHPPGMFAPSSNITAIADDLRLFRQRGVTFVTVEVEDFMGAGLNGEWMSYDLQSFIPLRVWLGMKLLDDPSRPLEPLLDSFFRGYYGASAEPMRSLLNLIEQKQQTMTENCSERRRHVWLEGMCDAEFFREAFRCLDAAESAAVGNESLRTRIYRERIVIDAAWLWSEGRVRRQGSREGAELPQRQAVIDRHRKDWNAYLRSAFDEEGLKIIRPFVETGLRTIEKLSAEDTDPFRTAQAAVEADVILDGSLQEAAWQSAKPLRLLPRDPAAANDDQSEFRFLWTQDALYVGVRQPQEIASAFWEVSLMAPDRKGTQLAIYAQPGDTIGAYFYRYPSSGGMEAVQNRKSGSRVVSHRNQPVVTAEIRIPWTDISEASENSATIAAGDFFLINVGSFRKPDDKVVTSISSPWLIGAAPAYNPAYHGTVQLGEQNAINNK